MLSMQHILGKAKEEIKGMCWKTDVEILKRFINTRISGPADRVGFHNYLTKLPQPSELTESLIWSYFSDKVCGLSTTSSKRQSKKNVNGD